jgi:hypothetical protein
MEGFTLRHIEHSYTQRLKCKQDVYNVQLHLEEWELVAVDLELKRVIDNLVTKVKEGLDPENDHIAFRLEHPDLNAKSFDVNHTRPNNLTSERVFTGMAKCNMPFRLSRRYDIIG